VFAVSNIQSINIFQLCNWLFSNAVNAQFQAVYEAQATYVVNISLVHHLNLHLSNIFLQPRFGFGFQAVCPSHITIAAKQLFVTASNVIL
jgi:hypothetical protein